ncbi:hypothetical protein BGW38_003527 [Lunasporangiospora selenospora]|uniref:Carbohydrate-binding module family 96 domain-containing protein n=1 Tax=Lunasporangiospora selenospora TaxID=979761 RepID=A0A9P6G0F4_9FUNG|nr:hypothetical protein BGW38_003527 [Lunasporangiospora selenospora]
MQIFDFRPLLVAFVLLVSLINMSQAAKLDTPATKDSTILRSTVSCWECPDRNCYKCTKGHEKTLQANTGGHAFIRSLIGFRLSKKVKSVTSCHVQFPAFVRQLEYGTNVTFAIAASSSWDESTVDGNNAPGSGNPFVTIHVPPKQNMGPIDITPACKKAAKDGQFSIYLGTVFGTIEIYSKDSGNPAILHVIYK